MSVLTEIMHERAAWNHRTIESAKRTRRVRLGLESTLLAVTAFVFYCYHAQLFDIARVVFH